MKKMTFVLAMLGLLSTQVFAEESFTLVDNYRGNQYLCSATGSMPTDEMCIPSVSDYCKKNTYESNKWCFDKASTYCIGKPTSFKGCVSNTADYCNKNTYETRKWCFEKALNACSGQPMNELLDAVKRNVYLKLKGINLKESLKP